ncbi:unnamed protein product [Citrullus colocynthis]|uniref:Uncharacterized protein n=1 Tax=Citrullus colocynthis TaxID=252529 RepID=A0ABP0Y6M7_9ROSI
MLNRLEISSCKSLKPQLGCMLKPEPDFFLTKSAFTFNAPSSLVQPPCKGGSSSITTFPPFEATLLDNLHKQRKYRVKEKEDGYPVGSKRKLKNSTCLVNTFKFIANQETNSIVMDV